MKSAKSEVQIMDSGEGKGRVLVVGSEPKFRKSVASVLSIKFEIIKMFQRFAARVDSSPRATRFFFFFEHMAKVAMFGCMNCGDCALFDVAYVCPMSQCPKQQRNGPCGGSYQGWCEVHPNEKKCVWVQAYDRLKAFKEEKKIEEYIVTPCNWNLLETSSWLNFYLGRDHTAKRLGIEPPRKKSAGKVKAKA